MKQNHQCRQKQVLQNLPCCSNIRKNTTTTASSQRKPGVDSFDLYVKQEAANKHPCCVLQQPVRLSLKVSSEKSNNTWQILQISEVWQDNNVSFLQLFTLLAAERWQGPRKSATHSQQHYHNSSFIPFLQIENLVKSKRKMSCNIIPAVQKLCVHRKPWISDISKVSVAALSKQR